MTREDIKEETKKVASTIVNKFQVYGFWCLLVLSIGFYAGVKYVNHTKATSTADSIKLGNFLYEGKVYEIKQRLVQ